LMNSIVASLSSLGRVWVESGRNRNRNRRRAATVAPRVRAE